MFSFDCLCNSVLQQRADIKMAKCMRNCGKCGKFVENVENVENVHNVGNGKVENFSEIET